LKIKLKKSPALLQEVDNPENISYGYVYGTIDGRLISHHNATTPYYGASMNKFMLAFVSLVANAHSTRQVEGGKRPSSAELKQYLHYSKRSAGSSEMNRALSGQRRTKPRGNRPADGEYVTADRAKQLALSTKEINGVLGEIGISRSLLPGIRYRSATNQQTPLGTFKFLSYLVKTARDTEAENNDEAKEILDLMKTPFAGHDSSWFRQTLRPWLGENGVQIDNIYGKGGWNPDPVGMNLGVVLNDDKILVLYSNDKRVADKKWGRKQIHNIILNILSGKAPARTAPPVAPKRQKLVPTNVGAPASVSFFPGSTCTCGVPAMKRFVDFTLQSNGKWCVGDLSRCPGAKKGCTSGHASHKIGNDIDIALPMKGGNCSINVNDDGLWIKKGGNIFKNIDVGQLDVARTVWLANAALASGAQFVFIDRKFHPALAQAAKDAGTPAHMYKKMFARDIDKDIPENWSSKHGIVRHWDHHESHLHIRLGGRAAREASTASLAAGPPEKKIGFWDLYRKRAGDPERCKEFKRLAVSESNYKIAAPDDPQNSFESFNKVWGPINYADLYCALEKHRHTFNHKTLEDFMKQDPFHTQPNYIFDLGHLRLLTLVKQIDIIARAAEKGEAIPEKDMAREYNKLIQSLRGKARVWSVDTIDCGGNDSECGPSEKCVQFRPGDWGCVPKGAVKEGRLKQNLKSIQLSIRKTNYKKSLLERKKMKPNNFKMSARTLQEHIRRILLENPGLLQRLEEGTPMPKDPRRAGAEETIKFLDKLRKKGGPLARFFLGKEAKLPDQRRLDWLLSMGGRGGTKGPMFTRSAWLAEKWISLPYQMITMVADDPELVAFLDEVWYKFTYSGALWYLARANGWLGLGRVGISIQKHPSKDPGGDIYRQSKGGSQYLPKWTHWTNIVTKLNPWRSDPTSGYGTGGLVEAFKAWGAASNATEEEKKEVEEKMKVLEVSFAQFDALCGSQELENKNKIKCSKLRAENIAVAMKDLDKAMKAIKITGQVPPEKTPYSPHEPWFLSADGKLAPGDNVMNLVSYNYWVGSMCEVLTKSRGPKQGFEDWISMIEDEKNTYLGKTMKDIFHKYLAHDPNFWPGGAKGASAFEQWTCPRLKPHQKEIVYNMIYGPETSK